MISLKESFNQTQCQIQTTIKKKSIQLACSSKDSLLIPYKYKHMYFLQS